MPRSNIVTMQIRSIVVVSPMAMTLGGCSEPNDLNVDLGWPLAVFLMVVFISLLFRRQLAGLIDRATRIDRTGISAEANVESQQNTSPQNREGIESLLAEVGGSRVVTEKENVIRTNIQNRGVMIEEGELVDVLIKHLALSQIILEFEQIYNTIFGSQIHLLKALNSSLQKGLPAEALNEHFEYFRSYSPAPSDTWTAKLYSNFLINCRLIDIRDNRLYLTDYGLEFLLWMTRNGRTELKPL